MIESGTALQQRGVAGEMVKHRKLETAVGKQKSLMLGVDVYQT